MAIPNKVTTYLEKKSAKYEPIVHRKVYTAYDAAQTLKKDLKDIAKSLVIKADKAYILVIVPASMRIDLGKLKKSIGAKKVSIPKENVMVKVFKVKPGAVTAFGGLHKVETIVDKSFLKTKDAIFSAGSFTDSVRMKVKDFIEMEEAKLESFAKAGGYKLQTKPKSSKGGSASGGKVVKIKITKKSIKKKPAKKITKKKPVKKAKKKKK
ncbi:YbaK/EbsC family protein [Patescibacteria group bacterium]|nr:YbaK/EbsC family protein [Patescibacteria group bacterium]